MQLIITNKVDLTIEPNVMAVLEAVKVVCLYGIDWVTDRKIIAKNVVTKVNLKKYSMYFTLMVIKQIVVQLILRQYAPTVRDPYIERAFVGVKGI